MARRRRGVNPKDLTTAQAEAKLRFGPDRAALGALVAEAKGQYQTDARVARGLGDAAARTARASRPELYRIYRDAARGVVKSQQDVEAAFGRAGVGSENPFVLANAASTAAYRQRLTQQSAQARRDATQAAADAKLGKVFGVGQAKAQYRSDLSKLSDRLTDLGDQEGAYIVSRLGALGETRANRRQQSRLQDQAQQDRLELEGAKHENRVAEAKAKAKAQGGVKPASRSELRSFKSNFAKALQIGSKYAQGDRPRRQAARHLTLGVPGSKTASGRAVPAISDQLAIDVALDVAYGRHVSRENERLLHRMGLRVDDLPGATSYKRWRRENPPSQIPIIGDILGAAGLR